MGTLLRKFFRRTGLLADVARIAAMAALAIVLALGVNAVRPMRLPLWPAPSQPAGVPLAVWQKIQFADVTDAARRNGAVLVDVREPRDYEAGHPPGAVNLPYREFNACFADSKGIIRKGTPLYLYCYGGKCGTSVRVANRLIQSGCTDVTIVHGGFEAWHERTAGEPAGEAAGG
jgi:rhodanese-related sulfurtransferase